MFLRLLLRSLGLRRGRSLAGFLALAAAVAAATANLTLEAGIESKLQREFRGYGANLVVTTDVSSPFTPAVLEKLRQVIGSRGRMVPYSYGIARTAAGNVVVVAGTDIAAARQMNSWWSVDGDVADSDDALVGIKAAAITGKRGEAVELVIAGKTIALKHAATLQSGAAEDSRIYVSLARLRLWPGMQPTVVEVAARGSAEEIERLRQRLQEAVPNARVEPIRQILQAEANAVTKTASVLLAVTAVLVVLGMLGAAVTLTSMALERRRDVAVMKALGASQRQVDLLFTAEASLLAVFGALAGYASGTGLAAWMGVRIFNAAMPPQPAVLGGMLAGALLVTLIASWAPLTALRAIQPAVILRGD